jgi:arylsulfatase A-like enzyme
VAFGVVLGLWYGLLEALAFETARLVPGALSWRAANASPVLVVAPLFYAVAFGVLGLLAAGVGRLLRREPDRALVLVCVALGGYLVLSVPGQFLAEWAKAFLGLGLGVAAMRAYVIRSDAVRRIARRSLPLLAASLPAVAVLVMGIPRLVEGRAVAAMPAAPVGAPNVLLLVIDGQRADRLSTYGHARPTSPAIDSLAAEGLLFETAVASSSWTLPSHATMFTGRHQHEHRAGIMRRPYLDDRLPTVAGVLAARGYATGGFVANTYWCGRQTGLARGFQHYEDLYGSVGDALGRTVGGRILVYDVLPKIGLRDVPGRKTAADVNAALLDWVDARRGRPFFAFVNYFDVHAPYRAPVPFRGRFSGTPHQRAVEGELNIGAPRTLEGSPTDVRAWLDGYDESLAYLDHELGALRDSLARRGLLDNTLIIVTSDHGEGFGEHGLGGHGNSLYLNQLQVPLVLRGPGVIAPGARVATPVGLDRLPATIAKAALGTTAPFPGGSLLDPAAVDTPVAMLARRFPVAGPWPSSRASLIAVIADRWLFITPDSGTAELYDYRADPTERRDLSRTAEGLQRVTALRAFLRRRLATSGSEAP